MKSFWKVVAFSACAAILLFGGVAGAAMNADNAGLPSFTPASVGLASSLTTSVSGKVGSLMCVSCHGRNPSALIASPTGTAQATTRHGSHWVSYNFQDTRSSGGYPDDGGKSGTFGRYIHRGPWAASGDGRISTGVSRYTSGTSAPYLTNTEPGATATIDNTFQIICESCHSITKNIGPKKLLAVATPNAAAADNGATLCVGCHFDMRNEVNNEPNYFKTGTVVQDHHRNQAANITGFSSLYTGTGSTTDRTDFVGLDQLSLTVYDNANLWGWAVGPGQPATAITATAREIVPVAVTVTNGVTIPSSGELHCQSCHRAHNAVSSAGALIIQAGSASNLAFGVMTAEDTNLGWVKTQRQVGSPKTYTTKLLQDDNGLCVACHSTK